MPNWCYNNTYIVGPGSERVRLVDQMEGDDGDHRLANIWPMPSVLKDTRSPAIDSPDPDPRWLLEVLAGTMTDAQLNELASERREQWQRGQTAFNETGFTNWYDWAVTNWGTKWGDCDTNVDVDYNDHVSKVWYTTAWSPAEDLVRRISARYPDLWFLTSFDEESRAFAGCFVHKAGIVLFEKSVDEPKRDEQPDESWPADKLDDYYIALEEEREEMLEATTFKLLETCVRQYVNGTAL